MGKTRPKGAKSIAWDIVPRRIKKGNSSLERAKTLYYSIACALSGLIHTSIFADAPLGQLSFNLTAMIEKYEIK